MKWGKYEFEDASSDGPEIAVVGVASRLPGAADYHEFWRNLKEGKESIQRLTDEQLRAAGVDQELVHDPNYVKVCAILDRLEQFDASFFGFSKREADVLDPQHRHFLEVCVEALEDAGIRPNEFEGSIGVFGGSGMNSYMPYNLFTNPELMRSMGLFLVRHTGNDKDFLTTRVSYCLDLKGPSVNVQTACSTSLVAIHAACQSLLAGECDAALAGGVTIELPHYQGYRYAEGEILSPDGHCRPFEANSQGTVFGSGAGAVVLRRLSDAIASGDQIHGLILGSAVNNDGSRKVGYLAPSVDGQAECIVEALQVAGISPRDVSYVECHGTGTPIGDPIEIAALRQAYERSTSDKQFCGVGSVKSNIGHLDTAAGVASFIKVLEMLKHGEMAPTLHFAAPNPQIDFGASPFFVVSQRTSWPRSQTPRRAGISSLGVGGTNAHIIVEEAPARTATDSQGNYPLVLTARSEASLKAHAQRLARHFDDNPDLRIADVCSTLLHGRNWYPHRRVLSAASVAEARRLLVEESDKSSVFDLVGPKQPVSAIFVFPGGGAQYPNMARELYDTDSVFRSVLDQCLEIVRRREGLSLASTMFPPVTTTASQPSGLERPSLALPALFSIELAYARALESWGIEPAAMLGHSLGEYVAAHLSGVLTLEDALAIVCCRGRLFDTVQRGGMLSVPMSPEALQPLLGERLSIAVTNAPEMTVVSGDSEALEALARQLASREVEARRLQIDVPAHSPLLDPILDAFRKELLPIRFGSPTIPYVSNLTADFLTADRIDSEYFVQHLRRTVRFSEGLERLLSRYPDAVIVEVGPGQALTSLIRQHPHHPREQPIVPVSPHAKDTSSDARHFVTSVARVLAHGVAPSKELSTRIPRHIVALPTTPFEHQYHWIAPGAGYFKSSASEETVAREPDHDRWFYCSVFHEQPLAPPNVGERERWLFLVDEGPLADALRLEAKVRGVEPIVVVPRPKTERLSEGLYGLDIEAVEDFGEVIQQVHATGPLPARIVHALCLGKELLDPDAEGTEPQLTRAFFSLLYLAQVLAQEDLGDGVEVVIATSRAVDVADTPCLRPLHALTHGPALVIPRETPELHVRVFDVLDPSDVAETARSVVVETGSPSVHSIVAERAGRRYANAVARQPLTAKPNAAPAIPEGAVVLFTGGLGGMARTLAGHFAKTHGARLVLVSRRQLPPPRDWLAQREKLDASDPMAVQLDWLIAQREAGHEVLVLSADVARSADMARVIDEARQRFGGIDVVVHAAGVVADQPLALKDRKRARAVLSPKVDGTRVLASALASTPPKLMLLIGSTSALLGPPGQIDYAAANAYVNAMAQREARQLPRTRVVALNFGIWREVGMAVDAVAGLVQAPSGEPTGHPLISRETRRGDTIEFESVYSPGTLWVLDEHRIRGASPVLPGTAMLEIARAAGARALGLGDSQPLEISDVLLIEPLIVADRESRLVSVSVEPGQPDSRLRQVPVVEVTLRSTGSGSDAPVEHARARVNRFEGALPAELPVADIQARCRARTLEFGEGEQTLPQDEHLAFGPHWKVIRTARFGDEEAIAELVVPEHLRHDTASLLLNPALLDMVSGFAFSLADKSGTGDQIRVPISYHRVQVFAAIPHEVVSFVRLRRVDGREGIAVFDVDVAEPRGRVVLKVSGYTTKSIAFGQRRGFRAEDKQPSMVERWLRQGISRSEGVEIVERVLADDSVVCVAASPTSLFAMLEELRPKPVARSEAPRSVAPASMDDVPRDEVELQLAGMWRSLLGTEQVGIRDDFFELGGHSLIAVRLFSRIKKAFGVDLSLAVLFEAPTIESCAAVIRKHLGVTFSPDRALAPEEAEARISPAVDKTFRALVPIQKGDGKYPLFVIHGAGGNVLNFRSLAVGMGPQQTFYGVQAKGVDGTPPSTTIEEMAELYLAEIERVVPNGPYLLGGYSGGGVVALEIAQRLVARSKRVDLLAFLDTFHPGTKARSYTLREHLKNLFEQGPGYATIRATGRLARQFDDLSIELKLRYLMNKGLPLPMELRDVQMQRAFYAAAEQYRPRPYTGKIKLFRARMVAEPYQHVGPTLGWADLLPNLEIIEVPGGHDSLVLEPNVQILVANLKAAIREIARLN